MAKKAFAKVAVQVALIWVEDCQINEWQFVDWWNFFGIEDRAAGGAGGIIPETGKEVVAATPLPPPPPARPDTFRQLLLIFSDCS